MKQLLYALTAIFALGCTKNSLTVDSLDVLDAQQSTFVSQEDAIDALNQFLNEFEPLTKSGRHRTIKNVYSSFDCSQTKSLNDPEEPLVYIMNFNDDEGFAVVSGDTRVQPILVLTDKGNIAQNDTITNPAAIAMLSTADTDYRKAVGLPIEDAEGNILEPYGTDSEGKYLYARAFDIAFDDKDVGGGTTSITYSYTPWVEYARRGTQLGCYWGQSSTPYNKYTYTSDGEKAPAGCVPAAVAQILFFWGHNFSMDGYYFDWDVMHRHTGTVSYRPAYDMIGELYLKLGLPKNLDVSYTANGSGAYDSNVPRTFVNCGFSSGGSIQDYNFNTIYNVISARPVYVSGSSIKEVTVKKFLGIKVKTTTAYKHGHAWVIDQVMTRERTKKKYVNGVYKSTSKEYEHLVHCNFGWGPYSDSGFYYSAHFDTNAGPITKSSTTTTYGERYHYQFVLKMDSDIYL